MKKGMEVRCPACNANLMGGGNGKITAIILDSGRIIKLGDPCYRIGSGERPEPSCKGTRDVAQIERLYWGTIMSTNVFMLVNDNNEVLSTIPGDKVEQIICEKFKLPEHHKDCEENE